MEHKSDCAVYNEPAYPKGHCVCGANKLDYLVSLFQKLFLHKSQYY